MLTAEEARNFHKNRIIEECLKTVEDEIISMSKWQDNSKSIYCSFSFRKNDKGYFKDVVAKLKELGYSVLVKKETTYDKETFFIDIDVSWEKNEDKKS